MFYGTINKMYCSITSITRKLTHSCKRAHSHRHTHACTIHTVSGCAIPSGVIGKQKRSKLCPRASPTLQESPLL